LSFIARWTCTVMWVIHFRNSIFLYTFLSKQTWRGRAKLFIVRSMCAVKYVQHLRAGVGWRQQRISERWWECLNTAGRSQTGRGVHGQVCAASPKLPVLFRQVRTPSVWEQHSRYVPHLHHAWYNSYIDAIYHYPVISSAYEVNLDRRISYVIKVIRLNNYYSLFYHPSYK
jgi:hypothetical protein